MLISSTNNSLSHRPQPNIFQSAVAGEFAWFRYLYFHSTRKQKPGPPHSEGATYFSLPCEHCAVVCLSLDHRLIWDWAVMSCWAGVWQTRLWRAPRGSPTVGRLPFPPGAPKKGFLFESSFQVSPGTLRKSLASRLPATQAPYGSAELTLFSQSTVFFFFVFTTKSHLLNRLWVNDAN